MAAAELQMERHELEGMETERHKMKTSQAQVKILVDFMEEYGDITKPSGALQDRVAKNTTWARLAEVLNAAADMNGQSRSIDKWKKVWGDLKNNTKRKALKLVRKPSDCLLRLTQLEYRLLKIMNMIKTTPMIRPVSPGGASPARALPLVSGLSAPLSPPPANELIELQFENAFERKFLKNPLLNGPKAEPNKSIETDDEFSWPKSPSPPSPQRIPLDNPDALEDCTALSDCALPSPRPAPRPACSGHTAARAASGPRRRSSLARLAGALLRGEARRRRRGAALERERLRLRTVELKVQQKWQTICERGLDLMERFLDRRGSTRPPGPMRAQPPMEVPEDAELNPDRDRWT